MFRAGPPAAAQEPEPELLEESPVQRPAIVGLAPVEWAEERLRLASSPARFVQ
jgi:hypothetical protein